jgi:hypothetical protein
MVSLAEKEIGPKYANIKMRILKLELQYTEYGIVS